MANAEHYLLLEPDEITVLSDDKHVSMVREGEAVKLYMDAVYAAAPDLLKALRGLVDEIKRSHPRMNVKKDYRLMVDLEAAKTAIAQATKAE